MKMLTTAELRAALDYDPKTGDFTWLSRDDVRPEWNTRYAGTQAGVLSKRGYVLIKLSGKMYFAHRLAWLYMTGTWPNADIDHINGERADNRFSNLREATRAQNCANSTAHQSNISGVRGVSICPSGKWKARISVNGKHRNLGHFARLEDAAAAVAFERKKVYGEFARVEG